MSSSNIICQLKTHFSCNCPSCTGEEPTAVDVSSSSFEKQISTSSSSSSTTTTYYTSYAQYTTTSEDSSSLSYNNCYLPTTTSSHISETVSSLIDLEFSSTTKNASDDDDDFSCSSYSVTSLSLFTLLLQQEEQSRLELTKSEQCDYDSVLVAQKRFIQKKRKHQRSYLQIAKSLKRKQQDLDEYFNKFVNTEDKKQNALNNQPSNLVFDIKLNPNNRKQHQRNLVRRYKKFRFNQKMTFHRLFKNNGPYMPNWCYEENCNSLRSLRELVVNLTSDLETLLTTDEEPQFHIFDRRLDIHHIRHPRTSAIANNIRRNWLLSKRIFNCETPFSQKVEFFENDSVSSPSHFEAIPAIDHKDDTRGERNFEVRTKFAGKDDSRRCNRNNGFTRNPARHNGWEGGRKWDMGNSRKDIFGKPWLHARAKKVYRGKDRGV